MTNYDVGTFEEWFYRDLEKWFSADIACCDACHDDFLAVWPYADSADDCHFQKTSIDLDTFYEGSFLRDEYSKEDFDLLVRQLYCPRCYSPLAGNIWPYEFPFRVPRSIERTLREVSMLANTTPFLLLEHDFCRNVLSAVRRLAASLPIKRLEQRLFRGRSLAHGSIEEELRSFDFPPPHLIQEGRYNHAGQPVLYLASDVSTCHAELRLAPSLVVGFELRAELRVLDLINPYRDHQASVRDVDLLNCLVYSSLVSARQESNGWQRPHYVVSRFVADCARACSVDAIRYPSTRRTGANFNLVVLNPELSLERFAENPLYYRCGAA